MIVESECKVREEEKLTLQDALRILSPKVCGVLTLHNLEAIGVGRWV